MGKDVRRLPLEYGVAILAVAGAVAIRWFINPWVDDHLPPATLYVAVAVAVSFGGYRPAVLAVALGFLACDYLFIEPRGVIALNKARDLIGLLAYLLSCSIIIGLGEAMRAAHRRADASRKNALDRQMQLDQEGKKRLEAEQARSQLAAIVESSDDAIISKDLSGIITSWNKGAERLYGYTADEVIGGPISLIISPDQPDELPGIINRLKRGERIENYEVQRVRKDHQRLAVSVSISPVKDEAGRIIGASAITRDISERRRSERRRNARMAITQVLAQSPSLPDAVPRILEAVCDGLGWDVGLFWRPDLLASVLRCEAVWRSPSAQVEDFEQASWQTTFAAGIGLPGRVWGTGQPAWIPDVGKDGNFPRGTAARQDGLHGGFSFPILNSTEVLGVMEFFSGDVREPDPDLLEMAATLSGQIGLFMERAQAEESLRESEHRFARFMQHLPGLAWIKDLQGRYVFANDAAMKVFRMPQSELYGRTDEEVFHSETAAQFKANDQRALAKGTGVQVIETLEHEDGILHFAIVSKFPILGLDEEPVLIGGMAIDVTEQMRAEQAQRAAQEQLHLVTDSMSAAVARCSRDLTYLWVSKPYADWLGRSQDEIVGRPIMEVIGDEAFGLLQPYFERALSGETVRYEEEVNYRELGQRWINAVYTPTLDLSGKVDGWVAVVLDINSRKRAEQALQEADHRKDEFLAMLAHELRNPLAPVVNALQIMKLPAGNVEANRQAREMMERQIHHLVRLIDDLLDISRITRGKIELRKERLDLATAIEDAVETSRPLIEAAGHTLTLTLLAPPVYVDADRTRLAQVFANLLNNSAKYTERGGHIWLVVERQGNDVVINVKDNGIGISADMLPKVFDMFTQVDRSLERSQGGLGIGLSLVRELIEMHGGKIEARSDGHGKGSEFTVWLPVVLSPVDVPQQESGEGDNNRHSSKYRILVVDDNMDSAISLAMMLNIVGHETRTAHDGLEAVDVAATFKPDVVLLDIGLPKLNGYEAAERIRKQPWGKRMMLIALTGWGQEEDRRRSKEAGFDYHLTKPLDVGMLQQLLHQAPSQVAGMVGLSELNERSTAKAP